MGEKRSRLTRNETLDVLRFVADVAARKDDGPAQRQFLVDGLERLAGCDAGFVYTCDDWLPGPTRVPRFTSAVYSTAGAALFAAYGRDVLAVHGIAADPYCGGTLSRDATDVNGAAVVSVGRNDVLADLDAQRRHAPFVEYAGEVGLGDGIVCFARLPGRPERMFGVGLHRADRGRRPVAGLHRARVDLAIAELAGLIPRGHLPMPEFAVGDDASTSRLPPRVREVLGHLLAGHNPKSIARTMGLSLWTVREYQAALYRHFDVAGRDELMARFVR